MQSSIEKNQFRNADSLLRSVVQLQPGSDARAWLYDLAQRTLCAEQITDALGEGPCTLQVFRNRDHRCKSRIACRGTVVNHDGETCQGCLDELGKRSTYALRSDRSQALEILGLDGTGSARELVFNTGERIACTNVHKDAMNWDIQIGYGLYVLSRSLSPEENVALEIFALDVMENLVEDQTWHRLEEYDAQREAHTQA